MKEMWDRRYAVDELVYGSRPNDFFANQLNDMKPGILLLPGEGEGRNAMYAAGKGWKVEAFDQSTVARDKAISRLTSAGLQMEYKICGHKEFDFSENRYDAIAVIFLHVTPGEMEEFHRKLVRSLKPGGRIIFQVFSKNQINNTSGGPRIPEMLYDVSMLQKDFSAMESLILEEMEVLLDEGPFHQGQASVINYVGIKN